MTNSIFGISASGTTLISVFRSAFSCLAFLNIHLDVDSSAHKSYSHPSLFADATKLGYKVLLLELYSLARGLEYIASTELLSFYVGDSCEFAHSYCLHNCTSTGRWRNL